ncbi:MAG: rhodanese-like domain-containing protein [Hydrogenophaga sp.]|nr:rhodanese-like domain-containing protein [Hydrogenophaga sp.]
MSFVLENWMLFAVALASGGMLLWPVLSSGGGAGGINPTEAVQLINHEKAVVVDVCSPQEYASGHVAGAKNVPLQDLESRLSNVAKNKNVPLVLVCASGMRSRRAVAIARKLGYENAHSLNGGIGAWRSANLPVDKA